MITSASLSGSATNRLVTLVFKKTWRLTRGTSCPAGVGTPPVQFKTTSPTSSDNPSALISGVDAALEKQLNVGVTCALAVAANNVATARAGNHLRKSTISFSL